MAHPLLPCYRVPAWCSGMRTHTIHLWLQPALLRLQAGCDAQQMYGNDSAVAEGLQHAYSLDLQLYAHARMLFCRALAGATSTTG